MPRRDAPGVIAFGIRHVLKVAPSDEVIVDLAGDVPSFVVLAAAWRAGCRVVARTDREPAPDAAASRADGHPVPPPALTCTGDPDAAAAALARGDRVLHLADASPPSDRACTAAGLALVCAGCSLAERGDLWFESAASGRRRVGGGGEAIAELMRLAGEVGIPDSEALEMVVGRAPPPSAPERPLLERPREDILAEAAEAAARLPGIASATRVFIPRVWRHPGPVHALVLVAQKGARWSGRRVAELDDGAEDAVADAPKTSTGGRAGPPPSDAAGRPGPTRGGATALARPPLDGAGGEQAPSSVAAGAVADVAERAAVTRRYVRAARASRVGVLPSSSRNAAAPLEAVEAAAALVDLADEREELQAALSARALARSLPGPRGTPSATCVLVGLDRRSARELGGPAAAATFFVDDWAASALL